MCAKLVKVSVRWDRGFAARYETANDAGPVAVDANRPARGLPPEQALERWAPEGTYAAMKELEDAKHHVSVPKGTEPTPQALRSREYKKKRDALIISLDERLQAGTLVASAIHEFAERREVLEPDVWDILWIDFEETEIVCENRRYLKPEIFEPSAIPLNIRHIPDWLIPPFQHDAGYRNVRLRGQAFQLGEFQGKVVAALHKVSQTDAQWISGKKLLGIAGAGTTKMLDLFKSQPEWRDLIESGGGGLYRLRI